MDEEIINNNIIQDDQETEALETISLTDFPIAQDHDHISPSQDHQNPPPSSPTGDLFEFSQEGLTHNPEHKNMSHAEDIIFCGKLLPIKQQHHLNTTNQHNQPIGYPRSRSESMAKAKTMGTSPLVRTSRSLDYKKMTRNSSMSSDPSAEISADGSGKKSASSRWYVFLFGLVKVPPSEMDIKDMKNRQVRRSGSKTPLCSSESFRMGSVSESVDHRKCSWRVLGFLSCKSATSAAVTTPVGLHA